MKIIGILLTVFFANYTAAQAAPCEDRAPLSKTAQDLINHGGTITYSSDCSVFIVRPKFIEYDSNGAVVGTKFIMAMTSPTYTCQYLGFKRKAVSSYYIYTLQELVSETNSWGPFSYVLLGKGSKVVEVGELPYGKIDAQRNFFYSITCQSK